MRLLRAFDRSNNKKRRLEATGHKRKNLRPVHLPPPAPDLASLINFLRVHLPAKQHHLPL